MFVWAFETVNARCRIARDESAETAAGAELRIVVAARQNVVAAGLVHAVVDLDVEVVDRHREIAGIAELRLQNDAVGQVVGGLGFEAGRGSAFTEHADAARRDERPDDRGSSEAQFAATGRS